jgi:hypothetical protein
MNKKILASAMILSIISFSAHGYEGHDYKIISETKAGHGFINGGIESRPVKKNLMGFAGTMYASALTWAYNAEGKVGEYVTVSTDHNISLSNYTKQAQTYTYTFSLSCESAYQTFTKSVVIQPGGSFSDASHNYGTVQKDQEGSFGINGSTQISGAESAFHDAHAILRIRK